MTIEIDELKAICELAAGGWKITTSRIADQFLLSMSCDDYWMIGNAGYINKGLPLLLVAACDALSGREWPLRNHLGEKRTVTRVILSRIVTSAKSHWEIGYRYAAIVDGYSDTPMEARLAALRAYLKAQQEQEGKARANQDIIAKAKVKKVKPEDSVI